MNLWRNALLNLRRVLEVARPDLLTEFDAIDRSIYGGTWMADWLNKNLGCHIIPEAQSITGLPAFVAAHLGVEVEFIKDPADALLQSASLPSSHGRCS